MNIAVLHEDGTENEFEIEMCCDLCANTSYKWNAYQFNKVLDKSGKGEPIKVPDNVDSEKKFIEFVAGCEANVL